MIEEEKEKILSEIACKLSSMTFILHGCCLYYEELELNSAKLVDFTKLLHDTSNELFDLL
jgi:hypothetical protein